VFAFFSFSLASCACWWTQILSGAVNSGGRVRPLLSCGRKRYCLGHLLR